jgi:hypothetical protein
LDIDLDSVVVESEGHVSADLRGEAVVLSVQRGSYFGLDEVGARIWSMLREPIQVLAIRDAIVSEFEVTPETCQRDLLEFLGELLSEGLIDVRTSTP